jgi:uncharacterized protein HemX
MADYKGALVRLDDLVEKIDGLTLSAMDRHNFEKLKRENDSLQRDFDRLMRDKPDAIGPNDLMDEAEQFTLDSLVSFVTHLTDIMEAWAQRYSDD